MVGIASDLDQLYSGGYVPSDVVFLVWAFKRIRSCYGKTFVLIRKMKD